MSRAPRLAACALLAAVVAPATPAGAQDAASETAGTEAIDDPKLERRLGSRIDLAPSPTSDVVVAEAAPSPEADATPTFGRDVVVAEATPSAAEPFVAKHPRAKLAYRRFNFSQIGGANGRSVGADEAFNVVSLDLYPVSSNWRFGLSTQYGWEDGTFRQNGDVILAETLAIGGQIPGDVFTPFFEIYGGGGLMQRTHASLNSIATVYGEAGVDVGTEIFLAKHAYISVAGGYLHSADWFLKKSVGSISGDTLCLKIGFGI
ncbi:MAG TPA: hypothetical protein VHJ20_21385 [Polyangia bacterium]|nr:hypothetical protein [Polyangia bacterium]